MARNFGLHQPDLRGGVPHIRLVPNGKIAEPVQPQEHDRRGWWHFAAAVGCSGLIMLAVIYGIVAFFLDDAKWILP